MSIAPRMSHDFVTSESNWVIPGKVLCGARPRNQTEICAIADTGVTTWVNLQLEEDQEDYKRLLLECRAERCFTFVSRGICDGGTFDDAELEAFVRDLCSRVTENNEVLFVHCKGGHGRTGIVVALLLLLLRDLSPKDALSETQR